MTVATTLGGGTSISRGLFIEMFLTTELVFVIIMLAAEKHKSTYLAPIGIGIAFFVAELSGTFAFLGTWGRWDGVMLTILSRCLLHWRFFESGPFPRPGCGEPQLPRLLLDLLGRPASRITAGVWLLHTAQVSSMEGVQPWAGLVSETWQPESIGLSARWHGDLQQQQQERD